MVATKQLIVCFKPGTRRSSCLQMHKEMKAKLVNEIKEIGIHVVTVPTKEFPSCLSKYASSRDVRFVEEDHEIQLSPITSATDFSSLETVSGSAIITNDPLLERQWGLANVNAQGAWELARVSPASARIAILDTGVNRNHPDLRGKVTHHANFSGSPTVEDIHGHGTHIAGIAAGTTNNGIGMAGMSYNSADIMNIKVLGDTGSGTHSNVAQGIIYAANLGADVINLSLGAPDSNETLRSAVNYANNQGVLLVGAAGNNSSNNAQYPAAFNQVLAVTATNQNNELSSFSNYGSWVEVAAPGQDILSTFPGESGDLMGYKVLSGTSQAAAIISGLAGLMKATNPTLSNRDIRSIIQRASIQSVSGEGTIRYGRIDAMRAIQLARNTRSSQRGQTNNLAPVWLNTTLIKPSFGAWNDF
ncbi:S8 family peptidase [Alkalihalobacterium chitinilyticum]|uniref:S8 family peptidase n=1 Tax=Alkalihalobacterium chitinilyticum TaxID=2980103 RepID=A0ABT5VK17_9BACI|nr:S8 family peptidase [Alkalihalobacterium chitinilyticum]MDE5415795.1 S8 family peptidase [Alkalihalobacterium chitinilyticum]